MGTIEVELSPVIYPSTLFFSSLDLRHACMRGFKLEIQVREFQMTLTETMKYGNINVHSVKWVKYHMGNTHSSIQ